MARPRRRSLLGRNDLPTSRGTDATDPDSLAPEDAPPLPRPASAPNRGRNDPPPDPGLVEFDLTFDELPDLPVEALDMTELEEIDYDDAAIEALEAEPDDPSVPSAMPPSAEPPSAPAGIAPPSHEPPPAPQPTAPSAPPAAHGWVAPPTAAVDVSLPAAPDASLPPFQAWTPPEAPSPAHTASRMALAFGGSMGITMALVLVPWFAFVSPTLAGVRARLATLSVPPPPVVLQVPAPQPVVPVEPVAEEPAQDTDVPEPASGQAEDAVVEADPPPTGGAVRPRPTPKPRPSTAPEPKLTVVPAAPKPKAQPAPAPAPAPKPAPTESSALSGRMSGNVAGEDVVMTLTFKAMGRLAAKIERGGRTMDLVGNYTPIGEEARFVLTEPGEGGWVYTGTADASGVSGTVQLPDGKRKKLKVKR